MKVFIVVKACVKNLERLKSSRETWLKNLPENFEYRFFIGGKDQNVPQADDIVVLNNVGDGYNNIYDKVYSAYKYALNNFEFDYLISTDDDVYWDFSQLEDIEGYDYIGQFNQHDHIDQSAYAIGASLIFSKRCVQYLAECYKNNKGLTILEDKLTLYFLKNKPEYFYNCKDLGNKVYDHDAYSLNLNKKYLMYFWSFRHNHVNDYMESIKMQHTLYNILSSNNSDKIYLYDKIFYFYETSKKYVKKFYYNSTTKQFIDHWLTYQGTINFNNSIATIDFDNRIIEVEYDEESGTYISENASLIENNTNFNSFPVGFRYFKVDDDLIYSCEKYMNTDGRIVQPEDFGGLMNSERIIHTHNNVVHVTHCNYGITRYDKNLAGRLFKTSIKLKSDYINPIVPDVKETAVTFFDGTKLSMHQIVSIKSFAKFYNVTILASNYIKNVPDNINVEYININALLEQCDEEIYKNDDKLKYYIISLLLLQKYNLVFNINTAFCLNYIKEKCALFVDNKTISLDVIKFDAYNKQEIFNTLKACLTNKMLYDSLLDNKEYYINELFKSILTASDLPIQITLKNFVSEYEIWPFICIKNNHYVKQIQKNYNILNLDINYINSNKKLSYITDNIDPESFYIKCFV
jgi:hypothetical protein